MANTHKSGSLADQAKETAGNAMDKGREQASGMMDKAKEQAGNIADKARETAGNAASWAGQRAEDATHGVGSGMKSLGETIREKGPHSGVLGSASASVGDSLSGAGRYLEEHGLSGIGQDLTDLIRRNPVPAMLVGVGLGFLLARMSSRS